MNHYQSKFNQQFKSGIVAEPPKEGLQTVIVGGEAQGGAVLKAVAIAVPGSVSQESFKCQVLPPSRISESLEKEPALPIAVHIQDYDIKKGGLFDSNYAMFIVKTRPYQWEVKRRYTDFDWLRKTLMRMYPGYIVPPIPSKKKIKSLDQVYLNKRRKVLENFIDYIMKNPLFERTVYVSDFLSIADEALFKQKQKEADAREPPKKVSEFQSLTGSIEVRNDDQIKIYANYFDGYLNSISQPYRSLKKNSKQLFLDLDSVSNSLVKIAENLAQLSDKTAFFNKSCNIGQVKPIENMYQIVNNFCLSWAQNIN